MQIKSHADQIILILAMKQAVLDSDMAAVLVGNEIMGNWHEFTHRQQQELIMLTPSGRSDRTSQFWDEFLRNAAPQHEGMIKRMANG